MDGELISMPPAKRTHNDIAWAFWETLSPKVRKRRACAALGVQVDVPAILA